MTFPSSGDVSPTTITSPTATWRRSSLPGSSSNAGLQNTSKTRRRTVAGFAVCLVLFLWVTSSSYRARHSAGYTSWRTALQQKYGAVSGSAESSGPARLVKLSMLYGNNTELLERALETQQKHSDQWGLEMRVMREDIQMEAFNKPSYLLSTIINELAKPHEQRADWIMWVDSDAIVLNPNVPPEIFLPPQELPEIHLVATQDHNGLNTGVMFLRVHPWSVSLLTAASAYPANHGDSNLGQIADQEAMRRVLGWSDGGWSDQGYHDGTVYVPRSWINAYGADRSYEGTKGDFLVHFAELDQDERREHMEDWLNILAKHGKEWEMPLEETGLRGNASEYWEQVQATKQAVRVMETKLAGMPNGTAEEIHDKERFGNQTTELKTTLWEHSDDVEQMRAATHNLVEGDL